MALHSPWQNKNHYSSSRPHFSIYIYTYIHIYLWRRQWPPTPVFLPGKSHGQRSLVGCSPWGHKESDRTERLHFHFSLSCIGEGNGNPLQSRIGLYSSTPNKDLIKEKLEFRVLQTCKGSFECKAFMIYHILENISLWSLLSIRKPCLNILYQ